MRDPIRTARAYHRATEYDRCAMEGHYLDWPSQPDVFKTYTGGSSFELARMQENERQDLCRLSRAPLLKKNEKRLDRDLLSAILQRAYSLTARSRHGGQDFYYRSVASAGALYPTELYISASAVTGVDSGLYHYSIGRFSLTSLRPYRVQHLVDGATGYGAGATAAATFIVSGLFFRSAWKYRSRAYRYVLLDGGHLLENLLLSLKSLSLPFVYGYDFNDDRLNQIVGVDARKEACLGFVHLLPVPEGGTTEPVGRFGELPDDLPAAMPVSPRIIDYGEIQQIHAAGASVTLSKSPEPPIEGNDIGVNVSEWTAVGPVESNGEVDYPEVVYRRRSKRNFVERPVSRGAFARIVDLLCSSHRCPEKTEAMPWKVLHVGLLVGQVEGLSPGFYLLDTERRRVGRVASGNLIREMSAVCLNQEWLANAALHVLFVANLEFIDRFCGPRGYRHVMMDAGRMGQMLYLAATENHLGCCGIGALYDGEARSLLGLNAESALVYLAAVGPVRAGG